MSEYRYTLAKFLRDWMLIIAMLFLTFCKIEPHQLRAHKWHLWLLAIQALSFCGIDTPRKPVADGERSGAHSGKGISGGVFEVEG